MRYWNVCAMLVLSSMMLFSAGCTNATASPTKAALTTSEEQDFLNEITRLTTVAEAQAKSQEEQVALLQEIRDELKQFNLDQVKSSCEAVETTGNGLEFRFFGAEWCSLCPPAKANAEEAANTLGATMIVYDVDNDAGFASKSGVSAPPTLIVVQNDKVLIRFAGAIQPETIVRKVQEKQSSQSAFRASNSGCDCPNCQCPSGSCPGGVCPVPQLSSVPGFNRADEISHLLNDGIHRGKYSLDQLESMTDLQLIDLHNAEHGTQTYNGIASNGNNVRWYQSGQPRYASVARTTYKSGGRLGGFFRMFSGCPGCG